MAQNHLEDYLAGLYREQAESQEKDKLAEALEMLTAEQLEMLLAEQEAPTPRAPSVQREKVASAAPVQREDPTAVDPEDAAFLQKFAEAVDFARGMAHKDYMKTAGAEAKAPGMLSKLWENVRGAAGKADEGAQWLGNKLTPQKAEDWGVQKLMDRGIRKAEKAQGPFPILDKPEAYRKGIRRAVGYGAPALGAAGVGGGTYAALRDKESSAATPISAYYAVLQSRMEE